MKAKNIHAQARDLRKAPTDRRRAFPYLSVTDGVIPGFNTAKQTDSCLEGVSYLAYCAHQP